MRKNRQNILLVIIGLLFPIITFSQENIKSYIYNDNGQLRIDTTLKISHEQFGIWYLAENNLLDLISNKVDFSRLAREAGITGIAIISFECDTMGIYNIRIIKNIGGGLDENIINGLEKISEKIVREFRIIQSIKNTYQINYLGTYYIPFDFSLINLREEMKRTNAIPIIDSKIQLNGRKFE